MFGFLEAITKQVTNHTTGLGAVWYILVLGFRVGVISTVGGGIYGDEQDEFDCSHEMVGCTSQCYNQFARLAPMRFWPFQMLFALTPAFFFHLYVMYTRSQISKIEAAKEAHKKKHEDPTAEDSMKEVLWLEKRSRKVGEYEMKMTQRGSEVVEVPHSKKLIFANVIHLVLRLIMELLGIIFSGIMFNIQDGYRGKPMGMNQFFWNSVSAIYYCQDLGEIHTSKACGAHFDNGAHVPCFVPRIYEKTVMLRYMNITSVICLCLTVYEIFAVVQRIFRDRRMRRSLSSAKRLRDMKSRFVRGEHAFMMEAPSPRREVRRHGHHNAAMSTTSSSSELYEVGSSASTRKHRELPNSRSAKVARSAGRRVDNNYV